MRRKLFTLAAGVSAVLCVGVCLLWLRSYWRHDEVLFRDFMVSSTEGWLLVLMCPGGLEEWLEPVQTPFGVEYERVPGTMRPHFHSYRAPHALFAFVLALPGVAAGVRDRRRRRIGLL